VPIPRCNNIGLPHDPGDHLCNQPATGVARLFDDRYFTCDAHPGAIVAAEGPGNLTVYRFTYDAGHNTVTWREGGHRFTAEVTELADGPTEATWPTNDDTLTCQVCGATGFTCQVTAPVYVWLDGEAGKVDRVTVDDENTSQVTSFLCENDHDPDAELAAALRELTDGTDWPQWQIG
jgi:hypothetical protein